MLRISQGHTVYFDHILPYLSSNSSQICPQPSPFPPSCPVCVLCSILMSLRSTYPQAHLHALFVFCVLSPSLMCAVHMFLNMHLYTGVWSAYQRPHRKAN